MVKKKYIIKIKHQDSRKMSQKLLQTCFTPKILNLNIFILVYTQSMKLFMSHFFIQWIISQIAALKFCWYLQINPNMTVPTLVDGDFTLWERLVELPQLIIFTMLQRTFGVFFLEQCLLKLTFMLTAVLSCNIWSANGEENIPIYTQQISRKEPFVIVSWTLISALCTKQLQSSR